jgi:hypothetical protein
MEVDYKELLRKYIEHVFQTEGVSFISKLNWSSNVGFSLTEVYELELLESNPYTEESSE